MKCLRLQKSLVDTFTCKQTYSIQFITHFHCSTEICKKSLQIVDIANVCIFFQLESLMVYD
ncbi:CLUMA_CG002307, isoform A [Clunio marinus]|uniref:CLUMA_CG002307, isoform A n=1 Tax=Clunio marinus TaxID=568069 RepID=A0A1J1HLV5_9DIPT|nr:CLUMA_CG002307, isoform A [Clunio marinus]